MAKKTLGAVKKRKKRKPRQKNNLKTNLKRIIAGVAILLVLVVAAGLLIHYLIVPKRSERPLRKSRNMAAQQKMAAHPSPSPFPHADNSAIVSLRRLPFVLHRKIERVNYDSWPGQDVLVLFKVV